MMISKSFLCLLAVLAFLSLGSLCYAGGTVTYEDRGNGLYVVNANGLSGIEAIRFTLTYDQNVLTNPRVDRGSFGTWMVFFPSLEKPGEVTVVLLNTSSNSGSGPLATIRFDKKASTQTKVGFVYELTGEDTITKGEATQTATETGSTAGTASESTQSSSGTPAIGSTAATTTGGGGTVVLGETRISETPGAAAEPAREPATGTVTSPPQAEPPRDTGPLVPVEEESEHDGGHVPTQHAPVTGEKRPKEKYTVYKGVIDRFRDFKGEKTPENLKALFAEKVVGNIIQAPPIALSDGKKTVTLKVDLGESGAAPNFALRGATLKSLGKDGSKWVVVVLPEARRTDAVLIIVAGERMIEYPLTVAPPVDVNIDKGDALTEKDFNLFLKEKGTDKAPRFDLNGDGERDYVDDFIFTANYLVVKGAGKEKARKK
ncbi:cohesin domain-containing protein [Geobacter sp.]|uniref:cohesin domain-containing protein n=1 Tax=Geobacter sp. TaxID=46610 RepID=UPI00262AB150|nr:cohesin domain-containing protein [Geobacter sp.]